jgi:hypothetical protein
MGRSGVAGLWADASGAHVQSWTFTVLGLAQLGVALALRSPVRRAGLWSHGLDLAVAGAGVLNRLESCGPAMESTASGWLRPTFGGWK